jgi:hypothetical protein
LSGGQILFRRRDNVLIILTLFVSRALSFRAGEKNVHPLCVLKKQKTKEWKKLNIVVLSVEDNTGKKEKDKLQHCFCLKLVLIGETIIT